jgi:hypothetical protein
MKTLLRSCVVLILVALASPTILHAQWVQTNGPFGGVATSLAVSGSTIFAGIDGAGIYRSTDNGSSWTAANVGVTSVFTYAFAVSGSNIFAGTSGGVFLSTNGGASWTAVSTGLTNTYIASLAISGANIFAGTGSGVFLSTNNGASWTSASSGVPANYIFSLAVSGSNIFAGTVSGGVYVSTNNGTTWTAANSGLPSRDILSLAASGSNIFAGARGGGVFVSTDNGASWVGTSVTGLSVAAFAIIGSSIFAGAETGVYLSTNSGTTWTAVNSSPANKRVNALAMSGSNVFAGTDGGVSLSTNNGATWSAVNSGIVGTSVRSFGTSGSTIFACAEGTGGFLSSDNGASWTSLNISAPNVYAFATSGANVFAGTDGGVFLSTNNGVSWSAVNSGLTYTSVGSLALGGSYLFAGTSGAGVFRSTNNGTSWTPANSGIASESILALVPTGSNLLAGTYGDGIFLSTDNGTSWTAVNSGLTDKTVRALVAVGTDVFAATYSGVFLSKNNGASWAAVNSGLASLYVFSLGVIGSSVLAETESGIFLSTNEGTSWTNASSGLPSAYPNACVYSVTTSGSNLFAGNYMGGVWRRPLSDFTPPATPAQVSPSNGAIGVSKTPTLSWNASTGAASYQLQVSTSSDFSSTVVNRSGITGTSSAVSGLSNNTLYYWRINATNDGGTSAYSGAWSFTTIVAAPAAPTLALPLNAATGVSLNPTLSWNASTGAASYRLQVSATSDFSTPVVDQSGIMGTSYVVSGLLNNTLYYWRVNATNAGGTSSYSGAWSFTTIVAAPAAPALASPSNAATGVSTSPTLSWNASTGAVSYQVQVSTSSSFSTTVVDQSGITGTSYAVSGLSNNTLYYWHVNATNAGGTSSYSGAWSFTTIVAAPPAPALALPSNAATGVSTSPTLSWSASSGSVSYRLQVSTSSDFSTVVVDQSSITGTSYAVSGLSNNMLYYWHVNATNAGGTSSYSGAWNFTTIVTAPAAPALASPTNAATGVLTNPTLSWSASTGAASYRLQISIASDFSTPVVDQSNITSTTYAVSGLSNNTLYYWRINATNAGGTSSYSNAWSFTTIVAAPAAPALASPSNAATGVSPSPTLSWTASTGAASYRLQVSTGSSFTTTVVDQSNITGTTYAVSGLSNNTLYYWRVNATNAGGTSSYSGTWNFTTITVASSVEQVGSAVPNEYALHQNYPNPFNPSTTVEFSIPKSGFVTLKLYSTLGLSIETLVDGILTAGRYAVRWSGSSQPSGVYFCRMQTGQFCDTKRLILLK